MSEDIVAILDCHGIAHAVKHATKRLTFRGYKTGVIFAFLGVVLGLQEKLKADIWVFAWDSRKSVRRDAMPSYKRDRTVDVDPKLKMLNDLVFPQFDSLRDHILPGIGFSNVFQLDGYEADDIMAQVVIDGNPRNQYIIVSSDNDMWQCLSMNCSVYNNTKDKYYTKFDFMDDWFNLEPEMWAIVKAIAGCASDNVKGIDGVGNATAAKMLAGMLGEHTAAYKKINDDINIQAAQTNMEFVSLPHRSTPPLPPVNPDEFSLRKFSEVCEHFGMKSFLKDPKWSRWKEAFVK